MMLLIKFSLTIKFLIPLYSKGVKYEAKVMDVVVEAKELNMRQRFPNLCVDYLLSLIVCIKRDRS